MKSFKSPIITAPENCAMQAGLAVLLLLLLLCEWVAGKGAAVPLSLLLAGLSQQTDGQNRSHRVKNAVFNQTGTRQLLLLLLVVRRSDRTACCCH